MTGVTVYRCTNTGCNRAQLIPVPNGLACPNGHNFAFAPDTEIPIFASEQQDNSEYSCDNAAQMHDNALRWVFATFQANEEDLRQRLVDRIGLKRGQRVLVTGAGAGNDLPYVAKALSGRGDIYAQDIAKEMLLAGVLRHGLQLEELGIGLHFSVSDASNLPFDDGFFDAAYHFGGINLFPDIAKGIAEMNRVVNPGGTIVIGDEGMAPWLVKSELGRMLINNNPLYANIPPLWALPETARSVKLSWELCNCFYVIEFQASQTPLTVNIDVPHLGKRGGTIRSRFFGQLEGVDPTLRERVYQEAERRGMSRVAFLESALRATLGES
jgi:ubiquinone/menaquinone biosynthesis C-methylase UbiE